MKTVFVTHLVTTPQTFCLVVEDEADLKRQLAQRQAALEKHVATQWAASCKTKKSSDGKVAFQEMSKDWKGFRSLDWNAGA